VRSQPLSFTRSAAGHFPQRRPAFRS